jgi:hypothetical protein
MLSRLDCAAAAAMAQKRNFFFGSDFKIPEQDETDAATPHDVSPTKRYAMQ